MSFSGSNINVKHPALFVEGGDSVGKNELVRSIAKYVLLSNPKQKVLFMNFPQYWFFGHDIRLVMRGACEELLKGIKGIEGAYLRSSLYSLDRNLALLLAESCIEQNPGIYVLSDRGPYSSCNTVGYLCAAEMLTEVEVKEQIVPQMFEFNDEGLLKYFDAKTILCSVDGEFKLGKRKALDNYEAELPQKFSNIAYKMLNLPEVITKVGNEWRPKIELAREALSKVGYENLAVAKIDESAFEADEILLNAYNEGRLILVGPELFLKHFNGEIEPRLKTWIKQWTELSLKNEVLSKKDRKEFLDDLETKIAKALKRGVKHYHYLTSRHSPNARQAITRLFVEYPILYEILHKTSGKQMTTFFEGLLSLEQLRLW